MKKSVPAENPDAYVESLTGWQRDCVQGLRVAVRSAAKLDEFVKWGHLVYYSNGPLLLIRAEEQRVLFGFWRGKRLRETDPRLKASGKYEMATIVLVEGMSIDPDTAQLLARKAVALNKSLGDPTDAAKAKTPKKKAIGQQYASKKATRKAVKARSVKPAKGK